jgi:hypothetical protein
LKLKIFIVGCRPIQFLILKIFWAKAFEGLEAVILVSKSHNPSKLSEGQLIEEHLFLPPKTETIVCPVTSTSLPLFLCNLATIVE